MTIIDQDRLARVSTLAKGAHKPPNGEFEACVMEAAAWVAGEPWSDHPKCACPVITAFMIVWNDGLPNDAERTRLLLPLIPKIVGTRGSEALANRRATMASDWYVRVQTPVWLRAAGLNAEVDALANFPEITDFAKTPLIMAPLNAAKDMAYKKWATAWDAAGDAAWAALKGPTAELQASATTLVERMCALTDADLGAALAPRRGE